MLVLLPLYLNILAHGSPVLKNLLIINHQTMAKGKSPLSLLGKGPRTRASNGVSAPKPKLFTFSLNHFHPRTKTFTETCKSLSVKTISRKKYALSSYEVKLSTIASIPMTTCPCLAKSTPSSPSTIDSDYLLNYPVPWKWNGTTPQTQKTIKDGTKKKDGIANEAN